MALAKLTIDFEAQLAKFESQLTGIGDAVERMGSKLGGLGSVFAGNLLSSAVESAITRLAELPGKLVDSVSAYQDFAEETGTTAAAFASLQTAMDASGTSGEAVAAAMVKLTTNLGKVSDDSKGAGAALAAIGLDLADFKSLKPDEQLEAVAKALQGFEDGAAKTAVAVALFGKDGAKLLPMLNDLAELGRNPFLTDEQIQAVDAFGKRSDVARGNIRQLAQVATAQAVPALDAFMGATVDAAKALVGVSAETGKLGADTAVADFAEGAVKALGFVIDAADGAGRYVQILGKAFGAAAAVKMAIGTGEFNQAKSILTDFGREVDEILNRTLFSTRLQGKLDEIKRAATQGGGQQKRKKQIDTSNLRGDEEAKEAKKAAEAYDKITAAIDEKLAAQQREVDLGRKLTDSEKFVEEMNARIAESAERMGPALAAQARQYLQASASALKLAAATIEARDAVAKNTAAYLDQADSARRSNDDLSLQVDLVGATASAQREAAAAREIDVAQRRLERTEAMLMLTQYDNERAALEKLADALRERIGLLKRQAGAERGQAESPAAGASRAIDEYLDKVKRAGDATREAVSRSIGTLEDDLVSSLKKGRLDVSSFVDTVLDEFLRLEVVRPLLGSLFEGGGGGATGGGGAIGSIMSAVSSIFGGFFADGGNPPVGKVSVVGERGPELIIPRAPSTVVPNGAFGGLSVNNYVTAQTGVSRAELDAAMAMAEARTKASILASIRNRGVFSG